MDYSYGAALVPAQYEDNLTSIEPHVHVIVIIHVYSCSHILSATPAWLGLGPESVELALIVLPFAMSGLIPVQRC